MEDAEATDRVEAGDTEDVSEAELSEQKTDDSGINSADGSMGG